MKPAIEIRNLGKQYKLTSTEPYIALRDVITQGVKNIFSGGKKTTEKFWALQDINLDIMPGERVGIIGRNGAGKSTLLKIISRITPPTTGEAIIRGRVGSLLEVGTGFHPELTGRENIYLNGSILGLKRTEINRQLDEIIDFSGVEKFIDTPLKRYSSGMQMRLAFSVAAHLQSEILLIDEVLAVGDMEFQKKCIGKMEEVSKSKGRTILFVSHNMAAVKNLCNHGIILKEGTIAFNGEMKEATDLYSQSFLNSVERLSYGQFDLSKHPNKKRNEEGLFKASLLINEVISEEFVPGCTLKIKVKYHLTTSLIDPEIGIVIKDQEHNSLIGLNNKHIGKKLSLITGQDAEAWIIIPNMNIYAPGRYYVDLYMGDSYHFYECLYDAFEFTVKQQDIFLSGVEPDPVWNKVYFPNMDIIA